MSVIKEGFRFVKQEGILADEIVNDNLDLLMIPQYGRNPDKTG